MSCKKIIPALLLLALTAGTAAARPRLIVQIVVGSMRAEDLDRYSANFGSGGFRRLVQGGLQADDASFAYQQTTTPVSLATLTTGAMPSTHGVVAARWRDYVEGQAVGLIDDPVAVGLDYFDDRGRYSPHRLIVQTLGESLSRRAPQGRIATVALDPLSAVVMGGRNGMTFWMEGDKCPWRSSSYYMPVLPEWVRKYNRERTASIYLMRTWSTLLPERFYLNDRRADIAITPSDAKGKGRDREAARRFTDIPCELTYTGDLDRMYYTPAGNTATLAFAKALVAQLNLGGDDEPDLLNISLDAARTIVEAYGPESVEAEDMYYRLDRDLEDFFDYLFAQVAPEQTVIVLTSAHGTSDSYDLGPEPRERFNVPQFEMILNTFLSARYGSGKWLLEYENQMLWLNHNLIYEKELSLADIQNEVAVFAMQFRGVSHALSATAMRTSYFGNGYAARMQHSFYPRRSGDVALNLMPGWIEENGLRRSASGSMYGYDRRVPLLVYGSGIAPQRIARPVDMTCMAPTLARLLEIPAPDASEGEVLREVIEKQTQTR